jgi:hypothetical protein
MNCSIYINKIVRIFREQFIRKFFAQLPCYYLTFSTVMYLHAYNIRNTANQEDSSLSCTFTRFLTNTCSENADSSRRVGHPSLQVAPTQKCVKFLSRRHRTLYRFHVINIAVNYRDFDTRVFINIHQTEKLASLVLEDRTWKVTGMINI